MKVSTRTWPGAQDLHVWQAQLDLERDELSELQAYLSTEERARADGYRNERDRSRYLVARAWLRYLLGSYVGDDPRALMFMPGAHGKPQLAGPAGKRLRFNASHSGDTALYAVACGREVGVDVERVRDDYPVREVSRRFLSKTEQQVLASLPAELQVRGFFECWTRKEAYLKALGVGLSGLGRSDADAAGWSLYSLDAGTGFAAALAVAGFTNVPAAAPPLHLKGRTGGRNGVRVAVLKI